MERLRISSGAALERRIGYSRAVRAGPFVQVAGTTAALPDGGVAGEGDAYAQAVHALRVIADALRAVGATPAHVVRTRMYVVNMDDWPAVLRAHGEVFSAIRPAATLVEVSRLIAPRLLVEIEADAIVP